LSVYATTWLQEELEYKENNKQGESRKELVMSKKQKHEGFSEAMQPTMEASAKAMEQMIADNTPTYTDNIEEVYKGHTIIVDRINGDNPFGCTDQRMGCYPRTCIVPDGEYKWIAVTWHVKAAKRIIDFYVGDITEEKFDKLNGSNNDNWYGNLIAK